MVSWALFLCLNNEYSLFTFISFNYVRYFKFFSNMISETLSETGK